MKVFGFVQWTFTTILLLSPIAAQHHDISAPSTAPVEENLGEISFPTSGPAEAQKHFIRGVLLLHSFEYGRAKIAFAEAVRIAPAFAMAYWGEAMTHNHPIWAEQDRDAALAVLNRLAPTPAERAAKVPTPREKLYFAAIEKLYDDGDKVQRDAAYSAAMAELSSRFPDDVEARAFYALSLLGLTGTDRNTENYMKAAGVAEELFVLNRNHPGTLHYLIHAYDDPVHAPLGLRAAKLYGTVAKGASHAQHMPSHIFFALGMWDDAISANIASMKTARDGGQGGYHPLHWLEHAYLQIGKTDDAAKLVAIVEADVKTKSSIQARNHLAMARATWLVETRGRDLPSVLDPIDGGGKYAGFEMARGVEFVRRSDLPNARQALERLKAAGDATIMGRILESAIEFASDNKEAAIRKAVEAAEAEDKMIFEYGPPPMVKPAWEHVGELYLKMGRAKEALDAFQRVLKVYPNRRLSNEGINAANALTVK